MATWDPLAGSKVPPDESVVLLIARGDRGEGGGGGGRGGDLPHAGIAGRLLPAASQAEIKQLVELRNKDLCNILRVSTVNILSLRTNTDREKNLLQL